ncbi:hypothetical protein BCR33DRAFT_472162 [Rhizoclosmatium globosum]|uniref:Uncharacterized protein n=1 Tax=Rhizoclosmatium globosum TaxID=329046 RepID=A0A1Y2BQ13_9FUNG|nr:hypothetical protein BCR33DRAFT_472162 [Rhizoclosmatium globosum]|eukprot:ORY36840.1 hypothetical protein BCR33DRAFT_472162 [Rhizoclosmatium globosum]
MKPLPVKVSQEFNDDSSEYSSIQAPSLLLPTATNAPRPPTTPKSPPKRPQRMTPIISEISVTEAPQQSHGIPSSPSVASLQHHPHPPPCPNQRLHYLPLPQPAYPCNEHRHTTYPPQHLFPAHPPQDPQKLQLPTQYPHSHSAITCATSPSSRLIPIPMLSRIQRTRRINGFLHRLI